MSDSEYSSIETDSDNGEIPTAVSPLTFFTKKELCYYRMVDRFFRAIPQADIVNMINIVSERSEISLRILDWFVTRFSKKRIDINLNDGRETFDVHISYRAQLKSYKKRYFDPFKRYKKFWYNYDKTDKTKLFYTTLGQLNFFKWAIGNNITKYVGTNLVNLTKMMNTSNKNDKEKEPTKRKRKTTETNKSTDNKTVKKVSNDIKISAVKTIENDEVQIVLSFD